MSNRDSLGYGDLLPQDVVEIFAQEKHSKKGRKQHHRRSIGRALGWLKGKKSKNVGDKAQNPGLGPALDLALDGRPAGYQGAPKGAQKSGKQGHQQSNSHAVTKRDDDDKTTAPLVLQENVFIEASRPKYLEDLHSEALEGLKLMQQEEHILGPEYQDNESTISTVSARAEVDGGGFTTDSTIPDTSSEVSVQSSVSSRSSRSGLTRQGSTFRPLNFGKKSDKSRTRRRHRRTIGSIPRHLQREFGLDRAEWTVNPPLEEEFLKRESDIPQLAVHSPPETNDIHPLNNVQEGLPHPAHVDDMALLHSVAQVPSGGGRPWSLAVPGVTTTGGVKPGPPSPVMSMSPQAAYLSKIIPNAVLPPSIEVVEISRGSSRNSVRTVSKSSLMLSSPDSSRASSRASGRSLSSRASTMTSASRQMHFHLSDSSCWSNSDSDTLVSDSSTISSNSTPQQSEAQDKEASKSQGSVHTDSKGTSNGRMIAKGDESKRDGAFVRSLSVKKSKRAPAPPNRSYSLHNKMKRRSRDLADVKIIQSQTSEANVTKIIDSPGYNADTSSLDESTGSKSPSPLKYQQNKDSTKNNVSTNASNAKKETLPNHSKVISPSSGYSSQDAMSPSNSSPKHKKGLLGKLYKLFPPSGATLPEAHKTTNASIIMVSEKQSVKMLRELFSIPPHPKVQAPPPPPPEVWSHSPRSIELLLGPPAPENTYTTVKKNPKDKRPYRQPPSTNTEGTVRGSAEEQGQSNRATESKKCHVSQEGSLNVENSERLIQTNAKEHGKVQVSGILNGVLVRTVDVDGQRLPAISEEKSSTQNTNNASISSAHISLQLPTTQTAAATTMSGQALASPESPWPPPPPPVPQAGMGSPDETDFPLPPPPVIIQEHIVLPVEVPSQNPVPCASNMSTSLEGNQAPPLNIPPPPSYTAPPPPVKTFSEKVQMFTSVSKDVSPPSPKVKPHKFSKPSAPQEPLVEIHALNITPPPDLIPPTPSTEVIIIPPIVADLPSPQPPQTASQSIKEASSHPTDISTVQQCEPKEDFSQSTVTNIIYVPTSEIIPHVSITKPADISPPPQIISKPPPEVTPPTQVSSPEKENFPPPPETLSSTSSDEPLPPVGVTWVPPEVAVPPYEEISTPAQNEVMQAPIPAIPEVSLKPVDASPQAPIEELSPPQEIPLPKDLPPSRSHVILDELPSANQEPTPAPLVVPPPPEEIPQSTKQAASPATVVIETGKVQVTEKSLSSVVEESSTFVVEKSVENSKQPSAEEGVSPPEDAHCISSPSKDSSPVSEVQISQIELDLTETDSNLPPWKSILTPPQSIPPPPPASDTLPSNQSKQSEEVSSNAPITAEVPSNEPITAEVPSNEPITAEEVPSEEPITAEVQSDEPITAEEVPSNEPITAEVPSNDLITAEEVPSEEPITAEVQSDEPITAEEVQSDEPITAEVPSDEPITAKEVQSDEPITAEEVPSNDPITAEEVPSNEPITAEEVPSDEPITAEVPSDEPITAKEVQSDEPITAEVPANEPITTEEVSLNEPKEVLPQTETIPTEPSPPQEPGVTFVSSPAEEMPKQESSDAAKQQNEDLASTSIKEELSETANHANDHKVNGNLDSPKADDDSKSEVSPEEQKTEDQTTTEGPQKPIRRSIISSPASPPAPVPVSPNHLKAPSSSTVLTTKSPTIAPSMNLQEAIRLRTAARSQNGPSSRLSIHSPPGFDMRKSPTSTASFIFSKSNKKVVIEAKAEKKTEVPVAKASVEQAKKKEFKKPPPVAKKPKTKAKDVEPEDTAGQDARTHAVKDDTQKPNGTAGTVGQ